MRVINFSEARDNLKRVLDRVVSDADYAIISRREAEDAVVISLGQFNGLMDAVHLLISPANAKYLAKSIEQYLAGNTDRHGLISG